MLIRMRTTLIIDDRLLREAKQVAAGRGTTVSALVNDALRTLLARPDERPRRFVMTTFGDPAAPDLHEPGDFAASLEDEDRARLRR